MAVYYLSSVNGDDTTADGTKALPYATLGAIPFTNGDLILVDSAHSSAESIAGPDPTAGAPIQIVSVDWNTGTGNADESYLPGASFSKYSGFNIYGAVYLFGITGQNQSNGYWFNIGSTSNSSDIYIKDGVLKQRDLALSMVGRQNTTSAVSTRVIIENTVFTPSDISTGGYLRCIGESNTLIKDCSLGRDVQTDGVLRPIGGCIVIDGLDLSVLTTGALLDLSGNGHVIVRNTPLPTGVSLISSGGISSAFLAGGELFYLSPSGSLDVVRAEGQAGTSGTVYRNGGATLSDGSAISFACVTTANAVSGVKSLEVPLDRRILDLSTAKTIRAYIAQDGGTALTNQDVWLEVRYRRPSDGLGQVVSSRPAAPHLAGTALPTDSVSTWTGLTTPNLQYVEAQVPADVAGDAHAEVLLHVAAPSVTVYVDPAVEVA